MKKKIVSIFICTLLIATSIVIIPTDPIVKADACEETGPINGLDYGYLWTQIREVVNVIYESYDGDDIRKGRFMGSIGGNDTCNDIIKYEMNEMNLDNVRTEKLEKIAKNNEDIYYDRMLDVVAYNFSLETEEYEFSNDIPKSEVFPTPCTKYKILEGGYDYTIEFDDAEILHQNFRLKQWHNWFDSSYEISEYDTYNEDYNELIGKLEYLTEQSQAPVNQTGRVYLFDRDDYSQDFLDNLTSANGVVLIDIGEDVTLDYSNNSYQVKEINESDGDELIDILNNNSDVMIDSISDNITVNYEFDDSFLPSVEYVVIDRIPNHTELAEDHNSDLLNSSHTGYPSTPHLLHYLKCVSIWSFVFVVINLLSILPVNCVSFVLYSSFDHHLMLPTHILWDEEDDGINYMGSPTDFPILGGMPMPYFLVNESLGEFLNDTREDTELDGDIHQDYYAGTVLDPGIEAYNAIGELNIDESPEDKYYIISNRYDGMWGETPGDSGIGTAIVLGLARHQKFLQQNYSVDPKYNITYLFTTGEEMGFRGAYYHRDNLSEEERNNIKMWIGFDQLGQDQSDLVLCPELRSPNDGPNAYTNLDIVWAIANLTNYEDISEYDFEPSVENKTGGSEDAVWGNKTCDTIVFVKDNARAWDRWHATGDGFDNGDSLKYTDPVDVNLTYEMAWHFVKYFLYDTDCWFGDITYTPYDSIEDGDSLNDSINVTFNLNTKTPVDIMHLKINRSVQYEGGLGVTGPWDEMNYTVNKTEEEKKYIFTVPSTGSEGNYSLTFKVYNFTETVKEFAGIDSFSYNDSDQSSYFKLYPYVYDTVGASINNVTDSPDPVGFGFNVTISADVTDDDPGNASGVQEVKIIISYPGPASKNGNFTMNHIDGDTYEYVFDDTWLVGQYNYTIWARDAYGNQNTSTGYSFTISSNATIGVCSIKNTYGANESINITDPPGGSPVIGYELLDDNSVLHVWNKYDSYYFNTSSGIQLTNHYDEYWSHNVLMLGYYNNDQWNLIYRTDELSGFNRDVDSDNDTFVNATLWKDLSYGGYDFRLAIRYHLGVDDNELTVIPYIKNIDDEDIPYMLGFGWELNDIQVDMTETGDYIDVGNESYYLNQSLDLSYTNLSDPIYCFNEVTNETEICDYSDPVFYIMENITETTTESLYLRWDKDLTYKLQVKSRTGQYNAPVTLFVRIGTINSGQEKYTEMFWYDASQETFYFDDYDQVDPGEAWTTNPSYMVDGSTSNFASTSTTEDVELCDGNSYSGGGTGTISKVEIRGHGSGPRRGAIIFRPVFGGSSDGDNHIFGVRPFSNTWSSWFDITEDTNAPGTWSWSDIGSLGCDVVAAEAIGTFYCSKVEIRVTFTVNSVPGISSPSPENGAINVSITPTLSINVSDADGDSMDITWYSNSSGSWSSFGTNNSVGNGTYYQTFSNATVNGQWWYWKVNVSDGSNTTESSVYKFYTGVQSKIVNSGSTNISGYLYMIVEYMNGSTWELDNDTINETTPRTINASDTLALDLIFNGLVDTSDLTHGDGTYRVYAAFRDPDGDVLVCDDESLLEAWWEFEVDTS